MPTKLATAPASGSSTSRSDGGDVERPVDEPEGAPADGRDERHLVAVRERAVALGVLPVHRVEEARRLVAEAERRPHVADARDVLELEASAARRVRAGRRRDGR